MDAFTPQQTVELVSRIGTKKAHMRLDKLFNSVMAGPLLGFGYTPFPLFATQLTPQAAQFSSPATQRRGTKSTLPA